MREGLINVLIALALTAIILGGLAFLAEKLIEPCILKSSPPPSDYPGYCKPIEKPTDHLAVLWPIVPLLLFPLFLWATRRVRRGKNVQ